MATIHTRNDMHHIGEGCAIALEDFNRQFGIGVGLIA
jgi:hypothetical protein